jgi:matrix metalloproteinase-14 (membrane-inserted)
MDTGYPKKIAQNFLGIPNNLDASFVWSWNNMVYFFKKHRYWRYNFDTPTKRAIPVHKNTKSTPLQRKRKGRHNVEIIQGYPKRILTNWPGIPDGIEDGFRAPNGRTYIFKGGEYWQFHDPDSKVEVRH